jgi:hypothetical protein
MPLAEDLILMLCIHGAKDCWEKLEWVSASHWPGAVVDPFSVNSPTFTIQIPVCTSLK